MADAKITALTELTTPVGADLIAIVDDVSVTPITKKITLTNLGIIDGWIPASETWTYASADDPTYTFTIASFDATAKYSAGMRIKLTNASVKYFIITKVTFDDPGSTITVYGGTDYDLADSAITANYYSTQKAPLGFPLDPLKWSEDTVNAGNALQGSPTNGTWYNPGTTSSQLVLPIGSWFLSYQAVFYINISAGTTIDGEISLGTSASAEGDTDLTARMYALAPTAFMLLHNRNKYKLISSKTTYYLVCKTRVNNTSNVGFIAGDNGDTVIRAVSAYL